MKLTLSEKVDKLARLESMQAMGEINYLFMYGYTKNFMCGNIEFEIETEKEVDSRLNEFKDQE